MTKSSIPLGQWSGSEATDRLHETVRASLAWSKVGAVAAVVAALLAAASLLVQVL